MDSEFANRRAHGAHVLFGLHQKRDSVKDFAMDFLKAARGTGFNKSELKVIFYSCLDEPLTETEQWVVKPMSFPDSVEYIMNREFRNPTGVFHPAPL